MIIAHADSCGIRTTFKGEKCPHVGRDSSDTFPHSSITDLGRLDVLDELAQPVVFLAAHVLLVEAALLHRERRLQLLVLLLLPTLPLLPPLPLRLLGPPLLLLFLLPPLRVVAVLLLLPLGLFLSLFLLCFPRLQ